MGAKPSKGTPADGRLKENRAGAKPPVKAGAIKPMSVKKPAKR